MTGPKKKAPLLPSHLHNSNSNSYQSLHRHPPPPPPPDDSVADGKENAVPVVFPSGCGGGGGHAFAGSNTGRWKKLEPEVAKSQQNKSAAAAAAAKLASLQQCIKSNEPPPSLKPWESVVPSSSDVWEFSDSESAPASSWSTLPNRSLLYRPLPLDVGRCTCIIVKERGHEMGGIAIYSLYTHEGQGRQDRKLAVARHRRRNGRSEFIIAQNPKGIFCTSDESFLGTITSNLMGSKYQILDQGRTLDSSKNHSRRLLGAVAYRPTISTITGNFRSMRVWVPKSQSMQLKNNSNATQIQHINGLPLDWEQKPNKTNQLCSRVPFYNSFTKRHELDFRERAGRMGPRIQPSVKNFQLTMEKGRQTLLQLGKIGRSKYTMDYRYPLTGYQAFCICLTSIDSKLCCAV